MSEWMEISHIGLHIQSGKTMDYLIDPGGTNTNIVRMGLTGLESWINGEVNTSFTNVNTAYALWANAATQTKMVTDDLNDAEKIFKPLYRKLYNVLRTGPLVHDSDLEAMGLPKRSDTPRTPSPIPTTKVILHASVIGPGAIRVDYEDEDGSKKKPKGVHGLEFVWAILDAPTEKWTDLTHSSFDTATPLNLTFAGEERKHTLYYAARWENTRGEKGPWNDIQTIIIP
jgi:hypothetical protein